MKGDGCENECPVAHKLLHSDSPVKKNMYLRDGNIIWLTPLVAPFY